MLMLMLPQSGANSGFHHSNTLFSLVLPVLQISISLIYRDFSFASSFLQANGYKPTPLDLSGMQLNDKMKDLVDLLAENTHNVWAKDRIKQGWTYGLIEVSYSADTHKRVDQDIIKQFRTCNLNEVSYLADIHNVWTKSGIK